MANVMFEKPEPLGSSIMPKVSESQYSPSNDSIRIMVEDQCTLDLDVLRYYPAEKSSSGSVSWLTD